MRFAWVTGLFALLAIGFWLMKRDPSPVAQNPAEAPALRELFQGPRSRETSPAKTKSPSEMKCQAFFAQLNEIALKDVESAPVPNSDGCTPLDSELTRYLHDYRVRCQLFLVEPSQRSGTSPDTLLDCRSALAMLRAFVTDHRFKGRDLETISDSRVLMDLLVVTEIRTDVMDGPSAREKAILERLWQIDPRSEDVTRFALAVAMNEFAFHVNRPEDREKAHIASQRWLERLESAAPTYPDLPALRLLVTTEGLNPEKLEREADYLARGNPPSGLGHFFMAVKASQSSESRKHLLEALAIEPENVKYKEALEELKTKGQVMVGFTSPGIFNLLMK